MSQPAAPENLNIRVFTQSGPICDIGGIAQALREYPFSKVGMRLRPYVTLDYADATASCKLVGQPKIIGSFHANQVVAKVRCYAFTVA